MPETAKPKVAKIFVGYKTKLAPGAEKLTPEFKAPANYKDQDKIAAYVAEQRAAFLAEAHVLPYVGTFEEVFLMDPQAVDEKDRDRRKCKALRFLCHPPEEAKPSVAVRVRNYLLKHYPSAWNNDTFARKRPEAVVVGFDPRTFLKIMGLECSLPAVARPCPLSLWYSNADHRDIGEAVCPKEFRGLDLAFVVKQRRPVESEDALKWDVITAGWTGPGASPEQDARIAVELAHQLCLLEE